MPSSPVHSILKNTKGQSTILLLNQEFVLSLFSIFILWTRKGLQLSMYPFFWVREGPKQQASWTTSSTPLQIKSGRKFSTGLKRNANSTNIWLLPLQRRISVFSPNSLCFSMTGYNPHHGSPCFVFLWRPLIPFVPYLPSLEFSGSLTEFLSTKAWRGTCAPPISNNGNNTRTGLGWAVLTPMYKSDLVLSPFSTEACLWTTFQWLPWIFPLLRCCICQCQQILFLLEVCFTPWFFSFTTHSSYSHGFLCYFCWLLYQKLRSLGFPGGSVVKNLPANAGDMGSSPGQGRSHMPRSNKVHIPQLLSLCSRAHKPQLLSLCATTTEARAPRARAPQREATAMRSPCTTTKRVAPAQQQRLNAVKNKYIKKNFKILPPVVSEHQLSPGLLLPLLSTFPP